MPSSSPPATPEIRVHVRPQYLPEQSDPIREVYGFAYTITVENHGSGSAQLISRRWLITDATLARVRSALDRIPRVPGSGLSDYEAILRAMAREGVDVPARLMATIGELRDAYGKS